jgi:flavodoxin
MNLQEQISRMKSIMELMTESKNSILDVDDMRISNRYNSDVVKLQQELIKKKYYIGKFGENGDGVDGKYGPLTKSAHKAYKDGITSDEFNKKFDLNSKNNVNGETISTDIKNIIIGDSQTPYVDMNTTKASRISRKPGKSSLWEGGKTVSWLISALKDFDESPNVNNVIIVIGTNGGFGKFSTDNISQLFKLLKNKFPNAKFYVVQGSWGWGGLKNIKEKDVRSYYQKFKEQGATIIDPPIGPIEPHSNKPIYKTIGSKIDELL